MGAPAKPSILKKYTKELFKRYDTRTAELTQIIREKESMQRKVDSLKVLVTTLEAEIQAQDELLAHFSPQQGMKCPAGIQGLMNEVRAKLVKVLKPGKP